MQLSPPDFVDLPAGPERSVGCPARAFLLVGDQRGRYVVQVNGPDPQEDQGLNVAVGGSAKRRSARRLEELAVLRAELDVYRRQLLEPAPARRSC